MSFYQNLQAKAARLVLGSGHIKEKYYYEITPDAQVHLDLEEGSSDNDCYLFNISSAFDKDDQQIKWYMQVFYLRSFLWRLFNWKAKKEDNTTVERRSLDEISQSIYEEITKRKIDPNKIIIKHSNPEQRLLIVTYINDKLSQNSKPQITDSHGVYRFEQIPVHHYVDRPENEDTVLDTIVIKPKNETGKYIINCTASARSYLDWIGDMKRDADSTNATVVGFSYRSVGLSSGQLISQQDVIDDIIAQVKYLIIEKQVDPKNITLYGLCMGGAFATLAASQLQDEDIPVKLYISRSYKRFDQAAADLLLPTKYDTWPIYIGKIICLPIIFPFTLLFKSCFWLLGWQVNTENALKKLKPENIEYDFAEPSDTDAKRGYCGDKLVLKSNSPYDLIQHKLTNHARKQAELVVQQEQDESLKQHLQLGADWAFGQGIDNWSEENALSMLLELEKTIQTLEEQTQVQNISGKTLASLQEELAKLKATQKGLCFARTGCQLAHQMVRKNHEERQWNPHASPAEKLKVYGFKGDHRTRLSWFVNQAPHLYSQQLEITESPIMAGG